MQASFILDLLDILYRFLILPIKLLIIYILTLIGIPF